MVQYGATPKTENRLTGFLGKVGDAALGAAAGGITGAIGEKVGGLAKGLFKPRNPGLLTAAQHPNAQMQRDREYAWDLWDK